MAKKDETPQANTGLFNFKSIMEDFYGSEPEAGSDTRARLKLRINN